MGQVQVRRLELPAGQLAGPHSAALECSTQGFDFIRKQQGTDGRVCK